MKITLLIDALNSGGAQRQMCMLAVLLKEHGHDIEVLTYYDLNFFRDIIDQYNIKRSCVFSKNKLSRIFKVRKAIRKRKPDIVIAYLEMPSLLAELAGLPFRKWKLIVSERNTDSQSCLRTKIKFFFHRFADRIVPNSNSQQKFIENNAPRLANKTKTIINCVDADHFAPTQSNKSSGPLKILIVGSFRPQKNPFKLLEALKILKENKPNFDFVVKWYGNKNLNICDSVDHYYSDIIDYVNNNSLQDVFKPYEPVGNLAPVYQNSDVFCLPSLHEGCPNVIGEAMACGMPVLASNVCDNAILVEEGVNGFLFDPNNPNDIASVIYKFSDLNEKDMQKMGINSRDKALSLLSKESFINNYTNLCKEILNNA